MPFYKVTINWKGELHTFYSHAKSPRKALLNGTRRLAKKLNLLYIKVRAYVLDGKNRYLIDEC